MIQLQLTCGLFESICRRLEKHLWVLLDISEVLMDFVRSVCELLMPWMMLEVLVPVQGHCLTFPPSGARLATLLCQGGGGGARSGFC